MKVLVIGAGAAGITAGHLLDERGVDFEILEASSVHGGRVRKLEGFADFPIDLGGEWIHKWIRARPAAFTSLLDGADNRFATFPDKPKTVSTWKGGRLRERNWLRHLPTPTDLKFTDSTWFDAIDTLATPAVLDRTRFGCPVASIEYGDANVRAITEDGSTYIGDKILVTVPIAMLQREAIQFNPPLPADKVAEIRRHVLGLFAQGTKAQRYVANTTDDALFQYVLAELDDIFSGKASQHYIQHVAQDWTREPYIMGSYSQRRASAKKLAEPVAGRLYFAGEAMNPNGKTIAVHGACESAYSAVGAMLG